MEGRKMKEAYADLLHIRRKVFAEIASLAYEGGDIIWKN